MKFWNNPFVKAIPLVLLLIAMALYKYRYTLRLVKPTENKVEAIDSSYLYRKIVRPTMSSGYVMGKLFNGIDGNKYDIVESMDSGVEVINSDQYSILKFYDEKSIMEVYISIRDMSLLDKVPFSVSFETGERILVTAFVKNKSGVNAMYGGTIHNNRGKLKLTGYSKYNNTVTGELDADLDGVLENAVCQVRGLKFHNALMKGNIGQ